MDLSSLLAEAFGLLVIGIVFVFLFLGVLVVVINCIARWAGDASDLPIQDTSPTAPQLDPTRLNPAVVAAISSAVHRYRQQHRNN
ncbi:OadG family protein [Dongshaea marina]|uniref:OadG family protein n=1 Tax=Dongshaea marina TaxID=2047966 RepID=UPI000D3E82F0